MTANRLTIVWVFLMVITAISRFVGHGPITSDALASAGVIGLAFVKVRLVGLDFMELRGAPKLARMIFELWVLLVGCVLITMAAV